MDAEQKELIDLVRGLNDKDKRRVFDAVSFLAWYENRTPAPLSQLISGAFELYRFRVLRFLRLETLI